MVFGTDTLPEWLWALTAAIGVLSSFWVSLDALRDLRSLPNPRPPITHRIALLNLWSSSGIGFVLTMLFIAGAYALSIPTNSSPEASRTGILIVQLLYTLVDLVLMSIPVLGMLTRKEVRRIDAADTTHGGLILPPYDRPPSEEKK